MKGKGGEREEFRKAVHLIKLQPCNNNQVTTRVKIYLKIYLETETF